MSKDWPDLTDEEIVHYEHVVRVEAPVGEKKPCRASKRRETDKIVEVRFCDKEFGHAGDHFFGYLKDPVGIMLTSDPAINGMRLMEEIKKRRKNK